MISDGGTHLYNKPFESLMKKYGITHKVAIPYHPQTSGQVELANMEIDTTKELMSSPKCRSVEVINNPARLGSNHREVNCIHYK